jgi:hypothetical protein
MPFEIMQVISLIGALPSGSGTNQDSASTAFAARKGTMWNMI